MGLQNQLNDVSSESISLLLIAFIANCVAHLHSFFLTLFCASRLAQTHVLDDGGHLGSGLVGLIVHKECFDGWLHHLNFSQFDANGDGKISSEELAAVLEALGSTHTQEEVQRAMEDIDTDKDGFINLEEFSQLCRSSSETSAKQELADAFALYDENKNGLISSEELHKVMQRLGLKCSIDECVRMIKSVDADGDGFVNFQEFETMMARNMSNGSVAPKV